MSRISESRQYSNVRVTRTEVAIRDAVTVATNSDPALTVEETLEALLRVVNTQAFMLRACQEERAEQ